MKLTELESKPEEIAENGYNLIYFDDSDIPELATGKTGYYVSLFTYQDGNIYTLMERWPYGVMGNVGYEYSPRKNSLRNFNNDFAGAIQYTTYMTMNEWHAMEEVVQIETYNFDDANKNGMPDENETESLGNYSVSYVDGAEISKDECVLYDVGEYEFIMAIMSTEELRKKLD